MSAISKTLIYVANYLPNSISVFSADSDVPIETVTSGYECSTPIALETDSLGDLYVVHDYCGDNAVTIYDAAARKRIGQITNGSLEPTAVAFDRNQKIYISNLRGPRLHLPGTISIYRRGHGFASRIITSGVCVPKKVVFDSLNRSYVANEFCGPKGLGSVEVFNATGSLLGTITKGVSHPFVLAVDRHDDVFVANFDPPSVAVYKPGTMVPARIITRGIGTHNTFPVAMLFDRCGNMYVANSGIVTPAGFVSVYARDSDRPKATIRSGISAPTGMALDSSDRLYVANYGYAANNNGWVSIFDPSSVVPRRLLKSGIKQPLDIAVYDERGGSALRK